MHWIAFILLMLILPANAHEIHSTTQFVNLRRNDQTGLQQDLIARIALSREFDVGAQGTYFERFDLYEERFGGFITYRPSLTWTFEARYLQGMGNDILPEKQVTLSAYLAAADGLSPFMYYNDSRYSITHLHTVSTGIEIEKMSNIIFIPSIMLGAATFNSPGETKGVHNYGLRVSYYVEKHFALLAYVYKGKEAAQRYVGRSSELVDTLSGGLGGTYYFTEGIRAELIFDHTDFDQLKTEFHTTTLNLAWMF